jgi:hypothetical protein
MRQAISVFKWTVVALTACLLIGCSDNGTGPEKKDPVSSDLEHKWSSCFGDAGTQHGNAVAADASGNVIVAGDFLGSVDFGGGALACVGQEDLFLAKFSPDGTHVWSQRFGGAKDQIPYDVIVDGSGNVIVTGEFWGDVDFGGGTFSSAGGSDIFVAKFSSGGSHLWSLQFGNSSLQEGREVAVDPSGNVIVTGHFYETLDFGGGALLSAGMADAFIAKFDPDGNHLWSKRFGDAYSQHSRGVAADASGNIFVAGEFDGTIDLGGGALTSAGSDDIFAAKFDPDGNHLWSKRFGDADDESLFAAVVDASGNLFLAGDFETSVDLGGGTLTSADANDIYIAKLNANGNHLWSKRFGGTGNDAALDVAVDPSGNAIVTGYFRSSVDFGGGNSHTSAGSNDIFVARFSPGGACLWSGVFGDSDDQYARGVAADASSNAIITGFFEGNVDFGDGDIPSAGSYDIFIAEFGP